MLGLLLLFWIGKYYYKLAEEHHKNKWLFAIIGIVAYYVGTFIAGIVIAFINPSFIENGNDIVLSLIVLPFGLLATYGLYVLLENNFKKSYINVIDELDDIGKKED
ncbi:hypothetical protein OOZ15_03845 [Galbibacter sp. EGI 63066]|uniref:hypothetical protein n=1 Tax=Galbibacter sp. EGI 63066 TaxID=2993559 RepID=UPI0022498A11|nr:hypothetical protein [Galbibacter sp. EGI 63066]MCX2679064.1 hypothetical protein [Galbibacter sp. EGI 63066]